MQKYFYFLVLSFLLSVNSFGNFNTPGTGVNWNLDSLVTNSGGLVTFAGGSYYFNDTIRVSLNDTLTITEDATVRFIPATYLSVRGTLIINPPTGVLFTADNPSTGYFGVRVDTSNSCVVRKLTFEYAVSFRLNDCTIIIDSCTFRNNNNSTSTTFGNGAVSLFRAKPVITNSLFTNNNRAAIQGGANIANAPQIIGNTFIGNNLTNQNVPQINLGQSGTDTVKILNNQILRASNNSGGIGFLPIGNLYTVISGNVIKNNRYGMTFSGGSNINALISYNQIDSNNTQNNPALGGSGIAFGGGSASSQQNTIVTGNLIRWNLWGITIQNRAKPNLGNITNADTTDDGKNYFLDNTNGSTPFIDLYNNTIDTIYAQNNNWSGFIDSALVDIRVMHNADSSNLGLVIFMPNIIPVELLSFSAEEMNGSVLMKWRTATELNNSGFEILRDGKAIAFIKGTGTTTETREYSFTDIKPLPGLRKYSLVQYDLDGSRTQLNEIEVEVYSPSEFSLMQNYPNPFNPSTTISFSVPEQGLVTLKVYNSLGEEEAVLLNKVVEPGNHSLIFEGKNLPSGIYFYKMVAGNFVSTKKMMLLK